MNNFLSNYPLTRPRRLRKTDWLRTLVCESRLRSSDLILPIFVSERKKSQEIEEMPGIKRYTIDEALEVVNKAKELGIKAVALFPEVPGYPRYVICVGATLLKKRLGLPFLVSPVKSIAISIFRLDDKILISSSLSFFTKWNSLKHDLTSSLQMFSFFSGPKEKPYNSNLVLSCDLKMPLIIWSTG